MMRRLRRERWLWASGVAWLAGCSAFLDLDGMSGGAPQAGGDATTPPTGDGDATTTGDTGIDDEEEDAGGDAAPEPSYASVVLEDEPIAYWRLGDVEGATADDETGRYPGAYTGAVQLGASGPLRGGTSRAAGFSQNVRMNADAVAKLPAATWSALTLEVWFAAADITIAGSILGFFHANGDNAPRLYRAEPTDLLRYLDVTNAMLFSTTTPAADTWYHLAVTIDTSGLATIYVNGVAENTLAMVTDRPAGNGFFALGVDYDRLADGGIAINDYWNGRLAEAAVYARALPAARIAAHYAARDL